jgi:hypothetical protein
VLPGTGPGGRLRSAPQLEPPDQLVAGRRDQRAGPWWDRGVFTGTLLRHPGARHAGLALIRVLGVRSWSHVGLLYRGVSRRSQVRGSPDPDFSTPTGPTPAFRSGFTASGPAVNST